MRMEKTSISKRITTKPTPPGWFFLCPHKTALRLKTILINVTFVKFVKAKSITH